MSGKSQRDTEYFATYGTITAANSPITLLMSTSMTQPAIWAEIYNDGTGDIIYSLSAGGNSYGDDQLVKASEKVLLGVDISVKLRSIKLTHTGTDCDYRVNAR